MFCYNLFEVLGHHQEFCKIMTLTGLFGLIFLLLIKLRDMLLLEYDRLSAASRLRIISGFMRHQSSLVIIYIRSFL